MNRIGKLKLLSGVAFAATVGAGLCMPASAAPVVRWVDNDSPGPAGQRSCTRAAYTTIQSAVDSANPGDTIIVCPGTYAENVTVLKSGLTIRSSDGKAVTTVAAPAGAPGFYVRATDVLVGRLTILMSDFGDQGVGINVANEGKSGVKLLENRVIGGRIGVNLGCASYSTTVGHTSLFRQTEVGVNVDTCEIAPFPGSRVNNIHHIEACSPTTSGSIALGSGSDLNHIHHNKVRTIAVAGTANHVHHNTTKVAIVDNGTLNVLHDNTVNPGMCP